MINICFGLHDGSGKYSKFVGTSMASIFETTNLAVTIHILHDATLTDDNRENFAKLAEKYNQSVEFYDVEKLCPEEIAFLREKLPDRINSRFSIGAFYRLLIKKILKTGKIIYLDADIIVNLDISELWQQDLGNFPVAAVPEMVATQKFLITDKFLLNKGIVEVNDYFCSGVIVFNLDKLDEKFFYVGTQFLVDNPACESPDQDILNAFFSKNYLKLAQKFDSFVIIDRRLNLPVTEKIYHYAGQTFGLDRDNPYDKLFLENFARTSWLNVETLFNLGEEIRNVNDDNSMRAQWLMKVCREHRRAFFVEPKNIKVIKGLFQIHDDEPIIELRNNNSFKELIAKMQKWRGQKMVFILFDKYDAVMELLVRHGFRENHHFLNGLMFMTRAQNGYTYTAPERNFVRAL